MEKLIQKTEGVLILMQHRLNISVMHEKSKSTRYFDLCYLLKQELEFFSYEVEINA